MTTTDPSQLTDEQLRVLVAEACGFTGIRPSKAYECWDGPPRIQTVGININGSIEVVPAYPTSLDACAEFERRLTNMETSIYVSRICDVLIASGEREITTFDFVTATARQRCIAFLKVKGRL